MARVYLARAQGEGGFERLVALKLLHDHLCQEQEFVAMFLDEARLAAQIRHPNVVATIDVQSEGRKRYLVMDYVEGEALSTLLATRAKTDSRLAIAVSLRIALDMLAGLHAAHDAKDPTGRPLGLVHRDVSPHNVLVGNDGLTRITDFGVARAETRLSSTRSGEIKGKLPYMAPEQIASMPIDRRADVYSAGLVLWEMLVGRRHFVADNQGALLRVILEGPLEPPSRYNAEVTPEIERVTLMAMTRQTERRYASAAAFAEEIENAAHKSGIRIATARHVAAAVGDSQSRAPKIEVPAAPPSVPSGSALAAPDLAADPHADIRTMTAIEPAALGPPTTTSGTVALVSQRDVPRSGRLLGLSMGLVALVAALAVGAFVFSNRNADPPAASAASSTVAATVHPAAAVAASEASEARPAERIAPSASSSSEEPAPRATSVKTKPMSPPVSSNRAAKPTKTSGKGGGAEFLPGEL